MKHFRKITAAVSILLAIVMLSACGAGSAKFDQIALGNTAKPLAAMTKVVFDDGVSFEDETMNYYYDGVAFVTKGTGADTRYGFYNLLTGEKSPVEYVDYYSAINNVSAAIVAKKIGDDKKWGVVDYKGTELIKFEYEQAEITYNAHFRALKVKGDLYQFNNKGELRKIVDGTKVSAISVAFGQIVAITDNYLYYKYSLTSTINVWDIKNAKIIFSYKPLLVDPVIEGAVVIGDSKLLIQRITVLPHDAAKYTVYSAAIGKVNLETFICNVKTGKMKEVKFDYLLGSVFATIVAAPGLSLPAGDIENRYLDPSFEYTVGKSFRNLTLITEATPIIDKIVYDDAAHATDLYVNDNLSIKAAVSGIDSVSRIDKNSFLTRDVYNNRYLTDKNGKVKLSFGNVYNVVSSGLDGVIMIGNIEGKLGLIDTKGKELAKIEYDDLYPYSGTHFFASKEIEGKIHYYRIDKSGKEEEIALGDNQSIVDFTESFYIIKTAGTEDKYSVYNIGGELLNTDAFAEYPGRSTFNSAETGALIGKVFHVGSDLYVSKVK